MTSDNYFAVDVGDVDDPETFLNVASKLRGVDVSVGQFIASDVSLLKKNRDAEKVFGEKAPGLNSRRRKLLLRPRSSQLTAHPHRDEPEHFAVLQFKRLL